MAMLLSERPTSSRRRSEDAGDRQSRDCHWELLHQLNWPGNGTTRAPETLGLMSCYRREGVSTLAVHLAVEAAKCDQQHRVLLVDANLACPSLHRVFELKPAPGLADCLVASEEPDICLQSAGQKNLSVLTAGNPRKTDVELYHAETLGQLVKSLRCDFDRVVFDLPPIGKTGAVIQLARLLDGVILVIEAERVRADAARRMTQQLGLANVTVLGAILNKRQQYEPR